MGKDFVATIREGSPREQNWLEVFGDRTIELQSPLPSPGSAPGIESAMFYMLDLEALTMEQRTRLIKHISRRFHVPEREVEQELDRVGCPILDEDVTVTVFNPQKWF